MLKIFTKDLQNQFLFEINKKDMKPFHINSIAEVHEEQGQCHHRYEMFVVTPLNVCSRQKKT